MTESLKKINDDIPLIEQWSMNEELNCFTYNANIFNPGYFRIKENSANRLIIDCDPVLGDCNHMIFSKQGSTLKVDIKISEWEEETVLFNISSVRVDELQKCDVEPDNNNFKFYEWYLVDNTLYFRVNLYVKILFFITAKFRK